MKIGITGSTGYVGEHLSRFLKGSGNEIVPIYLRKSTEIPREIDALIHLAAKSEDTADIKAEEYYEANVNLTKKVFQQFLESDSKDFIFFSTIKAVADLSANILTEESICNPTTHYGKSKLEAEKYLLEQKIPEGKRLLILRPVAIYGPGTTDNISKLFKFIEKGFPWPFSAYENKKSFLYIGNLNDTINNIINNGNVRSGIYHISDDDVFSVNQLLKTMADIEGKKISFMKIPRWLFKLLANIGDKLKLPFNNETLGKLVNDSFSDNGKLKKELNIEKMPYSTKKGLEITIKSFREQK